MTATAQIVGQFMDDNAASDDALWSAQRDQCVRKFGKGHARFVGIEISEIADMSDGIVGGTMFELRKIGIDFNDQFSLIRRKNTRL